MLMHFMPAELYSCLFFVWLLK